MAKLAEGDRQRMDPKHTESQVDQAGELRSSRIESLRAVAALGVLVGHVYVLSSPFDSAYVSQVLLGGGFGVYLFFTLSGYLLFWPFARRDYGDGESIDLRRFAQNRALRILPLYYFVVVVLLIFQEGGGSLKQWWMFATFSENFSPTTFGTVDGVMWSLVVELHFYLLLPVIALGIAWLSGRSLRRAAIILLGLGAASLAIRLATVTFDSDPNLYIRYGIVSVFFFFVSGMALALLRVAWRDRPPSWLRGPLASSTVWGLAGVGLMLIIWAEFDLEPLTAVASFLLTGACILPLRHGWLVRSLEWRPLAAIGVASYSLYLWHLPILEQVLAPLTDGSETFYVFLLTGGAVSVAAAFLSYQLVEVPFLRLRRRWARSSPAPRSGKPAPGSRIEAQPAPDRLGSG